MGTTNPCICFAGEGYRVHDQAHRPWHNAHDLYIQVFPQCLHPHNEPNIRK